jgi:hypothetical protein
MTKFLPFCREATIDLSFTSKKWLRTVMAQRNRQLSFGSILSILSVTVKTSRMADLN